MQSNYKLRNFNMTDELYLDLGYLSKYYGHDSTSALIRVKLTEYVNEEKRKMGVTEFPRETHTNKKSSKKVSRKLA